MLRRGGEDRRTFLLEKDTWIVATLGILFEAPFGRHLVFKGGMSLSKVWRAIRRFSEDTDITYDIRGFAPDLVAGGNEEVLPPTRGQERH
ncbi:nucleotidyl transferase AbiEii/AbiGii toxin family protein [Candidatus Palauibacter sp.]|uniref:nucleotidyl transferase AbiEii/AbiGii toxin family protein n=1 Tax=Candidatus Palauibacter sp. TaxID=3101350 RepID=UPI003B524658